MSILSAIILTQNGLLSRGTAEISEINPEIFDYSDILKITAIKTIDL
jgi:hypothetical protein